MFLHRFKKRGLRFRRGTVDFIGKNNIAENRTGLELEFGVAVVVLYDDVGTRNVRGHEVGRKLNTRKGKTEHASQGTYQSGLTDSGDAFEQYVAACNHGNDGSFDDFLLSDDVAADLRKNIFALFAELKNTFLCNHNLFCLALYLEIFKVFFVSLF